MAIGNAVQKGNFVYAYDLKGRQLFAKTGQLHGFTGATVAIRKASFIYTFDENGRQLTAVTAR
jgi:hypothetical protein